MYIQKWFGSTRCKEISFTGVCRVEELLSFPFFLLPFIVLSFSTLKFLDISWYKWCIFLVNLSVKYSVVLVDLLVDQVNYYYVFV